MAFRVKKLVPGKEKQEGDSSVYFLVSLEFVVTGYVGVAYIKRKHLKNTYRTIYQYVSISPIFTITAQGLFYSTKICIYLN